MTAETMKIREERPEDIEEIRALNFVSFGRSQEGALVDALRSNGGVSLSLVAMLGERVAGHALYSPVSIPRGKEKMIGAGLGPMAVLPELQRRGIGSQLIRAGNDTLRTRGCPFVVVLGHPEYYPRFGFCPASANGIRCGWRVPDNAFMILSLDPSKISGATRVAKYRDEFLEVL